MDDAGTITLGKDRTEVEAKTVHAPVKSAAESQREASLVEAFMDMGLDEATAKIAARGTG